MTDAGRVALLVDGDNVPASRAGWLLLRAADLGPVRIKRVFADPAHLRDWEASHGLTLVHARTGRNAADILLTLEAVDLWHRGVRAFALASSDADFAPVARWLVERDAAVLGLGDARATDDLRKSCTRFETFAAQERGAAPQTTPISARAIDSLGGSSASSAPPPRSAGASAAGR